MTEMTWRLEMAWRLERTRQHQLMTGMLSAAAGTVTALAAGIGVTSGRHLKTLRQQAAAGREVTV